MAETTISFAMQIAPVVRGQAYDIMPIPMMAQNAAWFDGGPVSFAIEARLLSESQDDKSGGGGSIHVFGADRTEEFVRFDCFDSEPHYHYINRAKGRNVVWGYDTASNGPMAQWALAAIRDRLPELLRSAGADELAGRVEREGFDQRVLAGMAEAALAAHERTLQDEAMLGETREWVARWQESLG